MDLSSKELEELLAEKEGLKRRWESLQRGDFWLVVNLLQAMVNVRRLGVFNTSIQGLSEAFDISRSQGEIAGMQLAISLPSIAIADLEADIQRLRSQGEQNAGNGNDTDRTTAP